MGYRIWRKDKNIWSLAFDTIYENQDKVNEAIAELRARYHELMKYGELEFLPYLDHIRIGRDGRIIEAGRLDERGSYHRRRSTQLSKGNKIK
jgi:hypothetical protein